MYVIGTAGHVDHGKSTLIEALTGTHPSRLKEEREREMTIDLGFGWLDLPGLETVGVIDVPGHRDFIENMLAGVGGIDAALLVIAADEGVMPQTREHLAILDLLQVSAGVVALTKTDLVDDDPEWVPLVMAEVEEALQGTVLARAPIVPVSARNKTGLEALKAALTATLQKRPAPVDLARPRLPVDRVFTVAGFGTVVTGTLTGGHLRVGDEVVLQPAGRTARIRGLQSHKSKLTDADPGRRLAVNLTGVDVDAVQRGDVVTRAGVMAVTTRLDVYFRHLEARLLVSEVPDLPLKHNAEVKVFIGAAEVLGRVRLLDAEALKPGERGWVQLVLDAPVAAMRGDKLILRRPSPAATLGGGVVVDATPGRRHKRRDVGVLGRLEMLRAGSPEDVLLERITAMGLVELRTAVEKSGLPSEQVQGAIDALVARGDVIALEAGPVSAGSKGIVAAAQPLAELNALLVRRVGEYHRENPLRAGYPREALKGQLGVVLARGFNALLSAASARGEIVEAGAVVRLPDFEVRFDADQQGRVDGLLRTLGRDPYNTPLPKDMALALDPEGEAILAALIEGGTLVAVSAEVVLLAETYAEMRAGVVKMLEDTGQVTVAEVRDRFKTSRKYALGLLEQLDQSGVTRRVGDARVLVRSGGR